MIQVKDILQHLKSLEIHKNIARLSFYNYLSLFHKKEEEFNFSTIEQFFLKSLYFSFWQENIISLQDSLILDLKQFSINGDIKELGKKELIYIRNPDTFLQYCEKIKNTDNYKSQTSLKKTISSQQKTTFLNKPTSLSQTASSEKKLKKSYDSQFLINHNRTLKIFTYPSNEKEVKIYTNIFFLNPPYLTHLPAISLLQYSYNGSLKLDQLHYLQVSPSETIVFFQNKLQLFTGLFISGYTYKITNSFTKLPLHKIELLYKNLNKFQDYLNLRKPQAIQHLSKPLNSHLDFNEVT